MFDIFKSKSSGYEHIDVDRCKDLIEEEEPVLLDVRAPEEKAQGEIPGSILINFFDPTFASKIQELDRDKTYIVYCRSGNRSKSACSLMASKGFKHLYNLKGGISAWNR